MYGICCTGGPRIRTVYVGNGAHTPMPSNNGVVFWFPEDNAFKFADNFCYAKRKDAEAALKVARARRVSMFLPYDGFSVCKIVKEKR